MGAAVVTASLRSLLAWLHPARLTTPVAVVPLVAALVVLAALAPLPIVLGAGRLVVLALLAMGAALMVGRAGSVDLSTGAVAGVGAYAGGVWAGLAGAPASLGAVTGVLAGAAVGAGLAAVAGRVGRTLSALTSLAGALGLVALLGAWPAAGGALGFHAVPLLTGGDRTDLAAVALVLGVAGAAAARLARTDLAAHAGAAVHSPAVARSLGRHPTAATALLGALAGGLLGGGGAVQAALAGSVAPAAYGLPLAAGLALAVIVGGAPPLGPILGALLLWGPQIIWPTAPVIGDAPALLTTGAILLAVRAWRGRPLLAWSAHAGAETSAAPDPGDAGGPRTEAGAACGADAHGPGPSVAGAALTVRGFALPGGERIDLTAAPGEVVAIVGHNGIGKSTLLAAIGGQVHDHATVRLDGEPAPPGAVARARAGVARTWQRPPAVAAGDLLLTAGAVGATSNVRAQAARRVRAHLGTEADTPAGVLLQAVAARLPRLVLLDEPAALLDPDAVARVVADLRDTGATVVIVEHRQDVVAQVADQVIELGGAT